MQRFIGKVIIKIDHCKDNKAINSRGWDVCIETITFETDEGESFVYNVEGDCCSQSWIESIESPGNILGERVTRIEYKELTNENDRDAWEEIRELGEDFIQFYNYDIITSKGTCTIDFRNSSNGFYGGRLVFNEKESVVKQGKEERDDEIERWRRVGAVVENKIY